MYKMKEKMISTPEHNLFLSGNYFLKKYIFNIGVDNIHIESYAGKTPPLSCMNDGLQVSTGGTVGHGLITLIEFPEFKLSAKFTFKGKKVVLTLKPNYWDILKNDIEKGIELYGKGTKENWEYLRILALKY